MRTVPGSLFEGVTKKHYSEKLIEEFRSQLIEQYERAIEEGIRPRDALAIVLTWVAAENCRLDAGSYIHP
ncbi:MAG TPA: hypothetical protein VE986_06410 [Hyphomicrobiales bacterium]|nr:hypothetical protein [Hyphomicrobiales bacterium]